MHISTQGLKLIEQSEGFRSTIYKDTSGIPTIGYGHRITHGESYPHGITQAQAEALLLRDVAAAETVVITLVKVPLTQGQFDALVDFVYNLGAGRLAASTLLRDLNAGHYLLAAAQILLWDHSSNEVSPGLKRRREAECHLFLTEPFEATLTPAQPLKRIPASASATSTTSKSVA
jgi:lysozyme